MDNNEPIDPGKVKFPGFGWGLHSYQTTQFFVKISEKGTMTHSVQINEAKNVYLKVRGCPYPYPTKITCNNDIENAIYFADKLKVCEGNGYSGHSEKCKGGVRIRIRCSACRASNKNERKKEKRAAVKLTKRQKINRKRSKKLHYLKKAYEGSKKRVSYKKKMTHLNFLAFILML